MFSFGHLEYDRWTLQKEYLRDYQKDLDTPKPIHYFPGDDPKKQPYFSWGLAATTFFNNWINYAVYQATPFDLKSLE